MPLASVLTGKEGILCRPSPWPPGRGGHHDCVVCTRKEVPLRSFQEPIGAPCHGALVHGR